MNITHEEVAANSIEITMVLEPADYKVSLDKELKKIRKEAHLKGFRKGAAPIGFIKKMYGQQILEDEIPRLAGDKLRAYLKEADIKVFYDNPIPLIPPTKIDVKEAKSYEFKYAIGTIDNFDPKLFSDENETLVPFYKVEVEESDVDEQVEKMLKDNGSLAEMEEIADDTDDVIGVLYELNDDFSPKDFKDAASNQYCFTKPETYKEDVWQQFLGLKTGAAVDLNISNVSNLEESEALRAFLYHNPEISSFVEENDGELVYKIHEPDSYKKYDDLMAEHTESIKDEVPEMPEASEEEEKKILNRKFRLEIKRATKHKPGELNEEFFQKFGVQDEVALREVITEHLEGQTEMISMNRFYEDVQKTVTEETGVKVPDHYAMTFFKDVNKSYLENQMKEKDVSMEEILEEEEMKENFEKFKKTLLVSALDEKLGNLLEIEVSQDELYQHLAHGCEQKYREGRSYGWIPADMNVEDFMKNHYMKDYSNVHRAHQSALRAKLVNTSMNTLNKEEKNITLKEFTELTSNG